MFSFPCIQDLGGTSPRHFKIYCYGMYMHTSCGVSVCIILHVQVLVVAALPLLVHHSSKTRVAFQLLKLWYQCISHKRWHAGCRVDTLFYFGVMFFTRNGQRLISTFKKCYI